jgi:HEAT repeat protein
MGKGSAAKRAARNMKSFNCRLTRTDSDKFSKKSVSVCEYLRLILLCVLFVFAGSSFSQNVALPQTQFDWLTEKTHLEQRIKSGDTEQKRDALFQIRNFGTEEASRIAIPALTDKSEIVRATAAFSVIFLPKDEASNVLLPLLKDKKELVRREAAYALGKVGNPNALNPLVQVLQKDKITDVKNAAIVALGEIGDAAAIDALTRILQNKPKKENPPDEFLRRSAAHSIGQIAQIIQTNKTVTSTPENLLPDKFNLIEKPKYPNLVKTFPVFRAAIDFLIQTLQNPRELDDVKRETAFALGAIGDEAAKNVLQANLNAEDYYLIQISKEALRKISVYANEKGLK